MTIYRCRDCRHVFDEEEAVLTRDAMYVGDVPTWLTSCPECKSADLEFFPRPDIPAFNSDE